MNKNKIYLYVGLILVGLVLGSLFTSKSTSFGGSADSLLFTQQAIYSTSSVGITDTTVLNADTGYRYLKVMNFGQGQVFCSFGTTAIVNNGFLINPVGSSTQTSISFSSESGIFPQALHCIANATPSTVGYVKAK
jgi:hypothetical protein